MVTLVTLRISGIEDIKALPAVDRLGIKAGDVVTLRVCGSRKTMYPHAPGLLCACARGAPPESPFRF